jgi:hypothetical protein
MKALEVALYYMFAKPAQPVVGEEIAPPVKTDISVIPKFRVPASCVSLTQGHSSSWLYRGIIRPCRHK